MPHETIQIVLIEDNPGDARLIIEMLRDTSIRHTTSHSETLADGLASLQQGKADFILLDLGLPDSHQLQGLELIVDRYPGLPVVVLTGLNSEEIGFSALKKGAQDFLNKDEINPAILQKTINYSIERQRLKSALHDATTHLQESENRLRQVIEKNSDGILIINHSGLVRFINPAAETLLGRSQEEILGLPFGFDLKDTNLTELRIPRRNGLEIICELRLVNTEWLAEQVTLVSLRDVTAQRRLEMQLRYAQKMESVGNLTRGVAHDFNNILAAIIGYGSVLEMKTIDQPLLQGPVQQILAAADRASALTKALLSFSRNQPGQMQKRDLLEMIQRVSQLIPAMLGQNISFSTRLTEPPLDVEIDAAQIEQVLFNLTSNARKAMKNGGALTLTVDRHELSAEFRKTNGFGRPGHYARIALTDTGEGIDEKTREMIFEPFFSTRETGDGTGLGLAISYGIVKQHHGYILCRSAPGNGSTFEILLPICP
jgi:PAS domain S-box-containing protein